MPALDPKSTARPRECHPAEATPGSTSRRSSFEREALHHLGALQGYALKVAQNKGDADDLVQETLLRAFMAWDSYRPGTNCRAWLLRILTNSFISERRRVARERRWIRRGETLVLVSAGRQRAARNPEAVLLDSALSDEVVAALAQLPPDFRRVVTLADLNGLTYREVAQRVGCPVGTVMSRLHRARRLLEGALADLARERGIGSAEAVAA